MIGDIVIEGLKVSTVIGCYDWERKIQQPLLIDLVLTCDIAQASRSDALADALDYATLSKRVIALCAERQFQLLEALAECLAQMIFDEFIVQRLELTIRKPSAVAEAAAVGVRITREASQSAR
jgi:dihydroneopterin aldolase